MSQETDTESTMATDQSLSLSGPALVGNISVDSLDDHRQHQQAPLLELTFDANNSLVDGPAYQTAADINLMDQDISVAVGPTVREAEEYADQMTSEIFEQVQETPVHAAATTVADTQAEANAVERETETNTHEPHAEHQVESQVNAEANTEVNAEANADAEARAEHDEVEAEVEAEAQPEVSPPPSPPPSAPVAPVLAPVPPVLIPTAAPPSSPPPPPPTATIPSAAPPSSPPPPPPPPTATTTTPEHSPVKERKPSGSMDTQASSSSYEPGDQVAAAAPELSAVKNVLMSTYSKVSHIFHWKRPIETGVIFAIGLSIIIALTFFSIISVVAYTALGVILASGLLRIYKTGMKALNRSPETPVDHLWEKVLNVDISLSPERLHDMVDSSHANLNASLVYFKQVLLVEDKIATSKFFLFLYSLTYIGSWFNGLTLITIIYLSLFSIPILYENNKTKIDEYVSLATNQISSTVAMVTSKLGIGSKKQN